MVRRLGELVDAAGGPVKASRIAEVSRQTIDQWRAGRSKIALTGASKLAEAAGRSLDWLVTGREATGTSQIVSYEPSPPVGYVPVPMLEVRASAGNGLVAMEAHPREHIFSFREDWMRQVGLVPGRVEAVWVTGDSMDPTIKDGDIILVDRQVDRVVDGGIYVLVVNGEVRVKRVFVKTNGALLLRSDNDVWPEELVPADEAHELIIEGRVRWFGRTI